MLIGGEEGARGTNQIYVNDLNDSDRTIEVDVPLLSYGKGNEGYGIYFGVLDFQKPDGCLDGAVLAVRDSTYTQGSVGFQTWGVGYAAFDNLSVTTQR